MGTNRLIFRIACFTALCVPFTLLGQQSSKIVSAYYPVWAIGNTPIGQPNEMYPHAMNWVGLTHIIHFGVGPTQTPPYWDPSTSHTALTGNTDSLEMFYGYTWRGNTTYNMIDSLRAYAHANGVQLVLSVGGTFGGGAAAMNFITEDSSRTQVFVQAAVAFASRNKYDGIEVNWEIPESGPQTDLLIRVLKREMTAVLGPNAPLIITVCPEGCQFAYNPALQDSVHHYWITMYDMARPVYGIGAPGSPSDVVGFNAPLHRPDSTTYPTLFQYTDNYDGIRQGVPNSTGVNSMLSLGFSPNKLVVGVPFYGYVFARRSAPNQPVDSVSQQYLNYSDVLLSLQRGGTRFFDNNARVPWVSGTATQAIGWQVPVDSLFYITYDDTISIKEKVAWAKGIPGIGGVGVYELSNGWIDLAPQGQRDPLLRVLVTAVDNPALTPVQTNPPNGATDLGTDVTLKWNPSTSAAYYRVQVSTDPGFAAIVVDQTNISARSFALSSLVRGISYYWRVVAINGSGAGTSSSEWVFSTAPPPPPPLAPLLSDPVDGAKGVPTNATLIWIASSGATSYRVQVSADAGFGKVVVDQDGIASPSLTLKGLAPTSTFYWRVNAANVGGTSAFSAVSSFTTAVRPAGLVAAYAFEEGSGITAADSSGFGTTGTIVGGVGAVWTTHERYGNALQLKLFGSYVDLGNPLVLQTTGSMSWSAWVRASADPPNDGQIIAKANDNCGWQFKTTPDTGPITFAVGVSADSLTLVQRYSKTTRMLNTWYHVAGVYDSAARTLDIYVNGVLDNALLNGTVPASQFVPHVNVNIGRRTGGFHFVGTVDEVRIYNRALTGPEILADMNTPLGVPPSLPGPPALTSPANAAVGVALNPNFAWNPSSGGSLYRIQVSTALDFSSTLADQSGITMTNYGLSGLVKNTPYFWRVSASDTGGDRGWSSIWSFTTQTADSIALPRGWNMISSYVQPNDSVLDVVCSHIKPNMLLMKNGKGGVYWPVFGINSVGAWTPCDGYQIYMQVADTLAVIGSLIQPQTCAMPLVQNWNLVGYVRNSPMRVDSALASIISDTLLILKNNVGQVFWPALGINTIGPMVPGQGYQLYVSRPAILTYPANSPSGQPAGAPGRAVKTLASRLSIPQHYPHELINTGVNAIVLVKSDALRDGDELAAWTTGHVLVGSGVLRSGSALLTIWGVNPLVKQEAAGAAEGEDISLSVWSSADQAEKPFVIESLTDGLTGKPLQDLKLRYSTNAAIIVRGTVLNATPASFDLSQNYPNPFNPTTVIQFQVPLTSRVSLRVYNILGQEVRTLVDDLRQAGTYAVEFNGTDLASGVYIYRMESKNFVKQKKLLLLK